jgi:hypothetical protein
MRCKASNPAVNSRPENTNDMTVEIADLKGEVAALRKTLTVMLATVLLLTIALNALFLWQCRTVRHQLTTARAELVQYQRSAQPTIDEFLSRLQRFAAIHPDFSPILSKYVPSSSNSAPRIKSQLPHTD